MNDRIDVRKTHKMFINGKFARSESERTFNWTTADTKDSTNICRASRKDFRDSVLAAKTPSLDGHLELPITELKSYIDAPRY